MKTQSMVLIGVICALICVLSPFAIPMPFSPVPFSVATFLWYLAAFLLPPGQAVCCCMLYLTIGMIGLPVFSGFSGGFGKITGPTGGYLIGYLFLTGISAVLLKNLSNKLWKRILALTLGTLVCYLTGTVWLCLQIQTCLAAGLMMGVVPYLFIDAVKIFAAASVGPIISRTVKRGMINSK